MEIDSEETENTVEGNQAQEIAVMTRSSILASDEIEEWKTAQEEDPFLHSCVSSISGFCGDFWS